MTAGRRILLRTESGQTAVEYIGALVVVVSLVVGLALASPGMAAAVGSVVKHAICRVGGGTACPKVTASAAGPSAADRAAQQRAAIAAIQKAWMAEQAQYQYVHG